MHLIISTHKLGDLPVVMENILRFAWMPKSVVVSCDAIHDDLSQYVRTIRPRFSCPLILVQRSHKGIARRGQTRNNGVRAIRATVKGSDLLYFLDGDICPDINHFKTLQNQPAYDVVIGRVIRLCAAASGDFKQRLLADQRFHLPLVQRVAFAKKVAKAKTTCWVRQLDLPWLGRWLPSYWPDLRSGNCAVRASMVFRVNGFDEAMVGWGFEDSDLGLRLYRAGARVTTFPWSCWAYHLWHPTAPGVASATWGRERLSTSGHWASYGLESAFEQKDSELQIER
jgi:hypothetical protein